VNKQASSSGTSGNGQGRPSGEPKAATTAQQARREAAKSLQQLPRWKEGVITALRRFAYVAALVIIWCVVLYTGIAPEMLMGSLTLVLSVGLFILAMPLGLFVRLDNLIGEWSGLYSDIGGLLAALVVIGINFVIVGALAGFLRRKKSE